MSVAAAGGVAAGRTVDAAAATLGENPVAVAAAVVGVVAGVLAAWWVLGRVRRSSGERFRRYLARHDEVSVLMHPNPDPDAMSSAMAVARLAEATDTDATIQYPGQIRHQENRAFETVLDADFDRISDASDLAAEEVVLVDHNEPRGFSGAATVEPDLVVDHHPGGGTGETFTDVRTDYGACASIFAEYFRDLDWDPVPPEAGTDANGDEESVLPSALSTALVYGIQSDTNHLTKGCSDAEFEASAFLYRGIDEERLDRIANPQVGAEVLEVKARAIADREVRNAFAVSDVGEVSNVDALPQAAEELLRLEGVTAVIVLGETDGTLHIKGRSRDDRVHMGKILRAVVEDIPMGSAGGHARMGGGNISVEHMQGLGPSEGLTREDFVDRLFDAMNGDV